MPAKRRQPSAPAKTEISFKVRTDIYPIEALTAAALHFIDGWHVFLDEKPSAPDTASITLRAKSPESVRGAADPRGEFHNKLLAESLRLSLGRRTAKLRRSQLEYAVGSALSQPQQEAPAAPKSKDIDEELKEIIKKARDADFADDPLGIAKPVSYAAARPGQQPRKK